MKLLTLTLLALTLLALPAAASADGPLQYSGFERDPESDFYRGVGAACEYALQQAGMSEREIIVQCWYFISIAKNGDWYHQPERKWELQRQPAGWGNET